MVSRSVGVLRSCVAQALMGRSGVFGHSLHQRLNRLRKNSMLKVREGRYGLQPVHKSSKIIRPLGPEVRFPFHFPRNHPFFRNL
jgi:hypothetical protein